VLQLASEGLSGPLIAERLFVAPATVKTHFDHIYEKLGVGRPRGRCGARAAYGSDQLIASSSTQRPV